ncbi:MAG: NAD(P)H-dependent oxidoreductase [Candidatus Levybacteria bacterium]|nr:NAD(P)H-dependent oxidoreductase [Candidatus Levybacteria bacterium]
MPQFAKFEAIEVELLDLRDYPLPFFDEPNSPEGLKGNYANKTAKRWAKKIGLADAFIIITPEYNRGPSAVLKNALDYVYYEWNRKPVAFVSYAPGAAAGIRAVEQLRLSCIELQMAPIREAVHISYVLDTIDEDGKLLRGHYNERQKLHEWKIKYEENNKRDRLLFRPCETRMGVISRQVTALLFHRYATM